MLEWSEFAQRLGRELAGLDRDTILIIRERAESRHYVQAMREADRLYAEAVSNFFLEGPLLLTPADEEVLRETGWRPPSDPGPRNWWTELPSFATVADHFRLADMMVHALRDVQGVRRPSDLVHESFHRLGTTGLIELVDLGIPPADPARVTERRSTPAPVSPQPPAAPAGDPAAEGPAASVNGVAQGAASAPPAQAGSDPLAQADPDGGELERRLAEAKRQGDHVTYFDLLLRSDLVLPLPEEPGAADPVTTTIAGTTYVVAFSSVGAMTAAMRPGSPTPPPHRLVSFGTLAATWPNPSWSLAVNAGLPSEILLDAAAIARLDQSRRTAGQPASPASLPTEPFSPEAAGPQQAPSPNGGTPPQAALPPDASVPPSRHATGSSPLPPDDHAASPRHAASVPQGAGPQPGGPAAPSQHTTPGGGIPVPDAHTGPQPTASDGQPTPNSPALVPNAGTGPQPTLGEHTTPGGVPAPHSGPAAQDDRTASPRHTASEGDVPPPEAHTGPQPAMPGGHAAPHHRAPHAGTGPQPTLGEHATPDGVPTPATHTGSHPAADSASPQGVSSGSGVPAAEAPSGPQPAGVGVPRPQDSGPQPVPGDGGSAPEAASGPQPAGAPFAQATGPQPAGHAVPGVPEGLGAPGRHTGPDTAGDRATSAPDDADERLAAAGTAAVPLSAPTPYEAAGSGPAAPGGPPAAAPAPPGRHAAPAGPTGAPSGDVRAIRLPQGAQIWEDLGDGTRSRPLAVYDAAGGGWVRMRVDAIGEPE